MNAVDGLGGKGKKIGVPVVHSGRIVVINHAKRDWGGMVTREKPTLLCFVFWYAHFCVIWCGTGMFGHVGAKKGPVVEHS